MKKVAAFIASGTGMGADAAKHLSSKEYSIAIMSSSGKGESLASNLGGFGFTGSNLISDDINKFLNETLSKFGKIDVLVNSAGHGPKGDILEIKDEDWIKGMEVYFLNVVRSSRIITPIMQKQKNGSIINISTFAIFEPITFPTAISELPSIAAIILTTSSGSEVPNATTVNPITNGGMPRRAAILTPPLTIHSAPKYSMVEPTARKMRLINI